MRIPLLTLALLASLLSSSAISLATPFTPASDATVLERLPFKTNAPAARELRQLRAALAEHPQDSELAIKLAQRYYQLALADGDPRFIGYAQAALTPWWEQQEPPLAVLVMRASLRQYNHDFINALTDLNQAIQREPRHGSAWSLLAAIYMVQADYPAARSACDRLHGLASELIVLACADTVDSLNGKAQQAYASLRQAYAKATTASPPARLWTLTRLAEMADRLNLPGEADTYFKAALQLNIEDAYLQASYAEFLLDANRYREVMDLLKGKERSDVLLIRLALAERALGAPLAKQHTQDIQARFDAARLRGDKLHLQDEARFQLYFFGDAKLSLQLAQENWQGQHEPSDARMLLEAALAANNATAAQPALDWYRQSYIEDHHLQTLVARLGQIARQP